MRKSKRVMQFTSAEVELAFLLVSKLNPDVYKHPEAKALILKCQSYREGEYDGGVVR